MTNQTKKRIIAALEQDAANAADNLYRAKSAFAGADLNKVYGESGKTRRSIIAEYNTWFNAAEKALTEAKESL